MFAVVGREEFGDETSAAVVWLGADETGAWRALLRRARGECSFGGSVLPRAAWDDGERVLCWADPEARSRAYMAVVRVPVDADIALGAGSVLEDLDGVARCVAPEWVRREKI